MKLYISDLDGTLFSDFSGFGAAQKDQLGALLEQGAAFTFATARVVPSAMQALGQPAISLPMIGCGGAVVQAADGTVLYERLMEPKVAAEAVALFKRLNLGMTVILSPRGKHERRWWTPEGFQLMDSFIASHWEDESFVKLESHHDVESLSLVGLSCCGAEGTLHAVGEWAKQYPDLRFELVDDPYQKGVQVGFLQDDRANKGDAVALLLEHLGLEPAGVTVFGDALNDLAMFDKKWLWKKVAVDCAVPELKALADQTLAADDSVLAYIEREFRR